MHKLIYVFSYALCLFFTPVVAANQVIQYENDNEVQDSPSHDIVRRVAFDIGSGQIKMQVSDVDITVGRIINVLLMDSAQVALREDLVKSLDGRLSLEIQNKLVNTISQFIKRAEPFHPTAYHAVGTESMRLAKNGNALADLIEKETGVPVTIISQEEEGILGFISAINESDVNPDKAIAWDFGGGSFQITIRSDGRFAVYQGRLGKIPVRNALLEIQGKDVRQTISPNPISKIEVDQAVRYIKDNIKDVPVEIIQKLHQQDAVVLGVGINPLWCMKNNTEFDRQRVLQEIEERLGLDDHAIGIKDSVDVKYKESIAYIVSNLILAYGIMDALDIHEVKYVGTQGANAMGTLLSSKYWKFNFHVTQEKN